MEQKATETTEAGDKIRADPLHSVSSVHSCSKKPPKGAKNARKFIDLCAPRVAARSAIHAISISDRVQNWDFCIKNWGPLGRVQKEKPVARTTYAPAERKAPFQKSPPRAAHARLIETDVTPWKPGHFES